MWKLQLNRVFEDEDTSSRVLLKKPKQPDTKKTATCHICVDAKNAVGLVAHLVSAIQVHDWDTCDENNSKRFCKMYIVSST